MASTVKDTAREGEEVFLPDEMMINIFKRLPVKSLCRFQCRCKNWKNLFKTPSFVVDLLQNSSHRDASRLLTRRFVRYAPFNIIVDVINDPMINTFSRVRIIGPSKGLFCLELQNGEISPNPLLLWNTMTWEARQVPKTVDDFKGDCYLGFGYSPIVNDYKIVRSYVPEFNNNEVNRAEVYSLSTRSWKQVEFESLEGVSLSSEAITVNGVVFWFGSKKGYDIAREVFTLIPMPNSHPNSSCDPCLYPISSPKLTVHQNKFAMRIRIGMDESRCIGIDKPHCYFNEFWVLEERKGASGERIWKWTFIEEPHNTPWVLEEVRRHHASDAPDSNVV